MIRVQLTSSGQKQGELLVVPVFSKEEPETEGLKAAVARRVRSFEGPKGWNADKDQVLSRELGGTAGAMARIYGLGKRSDFDADGLVVWLRRVVKESGQAGYQSVRIVLPKHDVTLDMAVAMSAYSAICLADYRFDRFRSTPGKTGVKSVRLVLSAEALAVFRKVARWSRELAAGVAAARDLGNTPPNEATPEWMAERCRELGRDYGMKVRVLTPSGLKRKKMGGILAVGEGSANPPRLVRMDWGTRGPIIALVGKGVTFDTGGISIKPAATMDEMKYDKCGACAVFGIARAAAALKLPFRFRAYLPLAENMPDGKAYRPGDIVRCYNGKTVEIMNTDAEGRMILADALSWAASEKPDVMLEYSTLTGATVVALGTGAAALYTPEDELAGDLLSAADRAGERLWRMPLWPEFGRAMKGNHGDLKNLGTRWGGANQAAAFLSEFVGDQQDWAHLDIAGGAYVGAGQAGTKGATGYGVPLTLLWLLSRAGKL